MTVLEAYYGLPNKVVFCKRCVISNQRPSSVVEFKNRNTPKSTIQIDEEGVCSACRYNEVKRDIDWKKREEMLFELLEPFRRNDGRYDVVVPSSGGKDSSFTAHCLKYKYGMNPLTITWAPNIYTDAGWNNLTSLSQVGGVDNLLYTPNGRLHSYLTRLAFLNLGHPFQPFIHGQKLVGPRIGRAFDIPLIMYGENQAEYGNQVDENAKPEMKQDFFTLDDPLELVLGGVPVKEILAEGTFKFSEFAPYLPSRKAEIEAKNIKMMYLGFFEKWDPQEMFYYASEHTGFRPAEERSVGTYSKYTEIDDKIVHFHFYTTFIKFGIGRATYDAAQEIRNGKIDRDEGVALVSKFDGEFPEESIDEFLDYIQIDKDTFHKKIDELRSPHLWTKVKGEWRLRHTVAKTGVDD